MEHDDETIDRHGEKAAVGAWLRLVRVFQKIERASAEQFAAHGLTAAQFDILAQLGRKEGISQQELAFRTKMAIRTIARWEGEQPPHGKALLRLADLAQASG